VLFSRAGTASSALPPTPPSARAYMKCMCLLWLCKFIVMGSINELYALVLQTRFPLTNARHLYSRTGILYSSPVSSASYPLS